MILHVLISLLFDVDRVIRFIECKYMEKLFGLQKMRYKFFIFFILSNSEK